MKLEKMILLKKVTTQRAIELVGVVWRRSRHTTPTTLQQQGCLSSYKKVNGF
jgi:hypothetical protein